MIFQQTYRQFSPTISFFLQLAVILHSSPLAKADVPLVVTEPAYTTVDSILYIQGGSQTFDGTTLTSLLFSLNLAKPYYSTNPPWTSHPSTFPTNSLVSTPPLTWKHAMSWTPNKSLFIWWEGGDQKQLTTFNITANTWSAQGEVSGSTNIAYQFGYKIYMDLAYNGYIPNGCNYNAAVCKYSNPYANTTILGWWPTGQEPVTGGEPPHIPIGITSYSWTFSNLRISALLYGGVGIGVASSPPNSPLLYEYLSANNQWNLLAPAGAGPGDVSSHCMVETSDQSKMILFGGVSLSQTVSGGLFILDVKSLTWTQGVSVPVSQARYGHACATNGDSFLVWGGQNTTAMMSVEPLIYNILLNQWVSDFVISGPLPVRTTTTAIGATTTVPTPVSSMSASEPTNTHSPSGKKSNLGAKAGGAIGGIAAIGIAIFVGYSARKRQKRKQENSSQWLGIETKKSNQFSNNFEDRSNFGNKDRILLHQDAALNGASLEQNYAYPPPPPLRPNETEPKSGSYKEFSPQYIPPPSAATASAHYSVYSAIPQDVRGSSHGLDPHANLSYREMDSFSRSSPSLPIPAPMNPHVPQLPDGYQNMGFDPYASLSGPPTGIQAASFASSPLCRPDPISQYASPRVDSTFNGWRTGETGSAMTWTGELDQRRAPQLNPRPSPPSSSQSWNHSRSIGSSPQEGAVGNMGASVTGASSFSFPQPSLDRARPLNLQGNSPVQSPHSPTSPNVSAPLSRSSPLSAPITKENAVNVTAENAEMKARKLALMKAQLEYDLEQIRLEEEAQRLSIV